MTQQEILAKVKKLMALATSDNAHEAAQAAARAQQILDKYELSQAMLEIDGEASETSDEDIEDFARKSDPLYQTEGRSLPRWRAVLGDTIAKANGCRVYMGTMFISGKGMRRALSIVGRASDVSKVRYLFAYLGNEVDRLCERDGRGRGATWRNNFRHGVVCAIGDALKATKAQAADELRNEAGGDMFALVKVDKALDRMRANDDAVERWLEQNMRLRSTGGKARGNADAHARGRQAGKEIKMNAARGSLGTGQGRLRN